MLNPSTADDVRDDPTIRRCIGLSRAWGFGGIDVVNLYGLRATDPADLRAARDPVGADNDGAIARAARRADAVFAAWGIHADEARVTAVRRLLAGCALWCLGRTRDGHPRHPLYVPGAVRPERWPTAACA
jgi:hypothetical protein